MDAIFPGRTSTSHAQILPSRSRPPREYDSAAPDRLHRLQCIDIADGFVGTDPDDARKTQRVATRVTLAFLDSIERHLDDDDGLDEPEPAKILDRVLFEKLRHLENL